MTCKITRQAWKRCLMAYFEEGIADYPDCFAQRTTPHEDMPALKFTETCAYFLATRWGLAI